MSLSHPSKAKPCATKLICTIGPACCTPAKMLALLEAGMDIARLHFSYGDHAEHTENFRRLRQAAILARKPLAILQDLTGTKVRMLDFAEAKVTLEAGKEFTLTTRKVIGDARRVSLNFPELISVIKPGDTVLLADGELKLEAIAVTRHEARCRIIVGGRIKSQQAVHVPGKAAPLRVPTAKDSRDVVFALQQGVDWIAQSFATTAGEIRDLRRFIHAQGKRTPIIVKIERREALDNLEALVRAADAVMVARGDLGMAIPLGEIPFAQKHIIRTANAAGKPVITATEMLFSMMKQPHPTRADVTDIANAILDGSDAVMLSGETAMGKYPIEAAATARRIATYADQHLPAGSTRMSAKPHLAW